MRLVLIALKIVFLAIQLVIVLIALMAMKNMKEFVFVPSKIVSLA